MSTDCEIYKLQTEAAVNPVPVLCMITMTYPCLMWSPDAGRRVDSWRKKALQLGQQTTYSQVVSQEQIHTRGSGHLEVTLGTRPVVKLGSCSHSWSSLVSVKTQERLL